MILSKYFFKKSQKNIWQVEKKFIPLQRFRERRSSLSKEDCLMV